MRKISTFLILVIVFLGISGLNLTGQNFINLEAQAQTLTNPLGKDVDSPSALIGKILQAVLGLVGSLSLLMFVFGGITWMTSSGSVEQVKKGRDILIWAAIGLVVVFASYAIVRVVLLSLGADKV